MSKCSYGDCKTKVALVVGDCKYCIKRFCMKHSLPEQHQCHNIELCKRIAIDRNSAELLKFKCVGNKI